MLAVGMLRINSFRVGASHFSLWSTSMCSTLRAGVRRSRRSCGAVPAQRKVTRRKHTLTARPRCARVRDWARNFRTGRPAPSGNSAHPCALPCGLYLPQPPCLTGDWRSQARARARARTTAKAEARTSAVAVAVASAFASARTFATAPALAPAHAPLSRKASRAPQVDVAAEAPLSERSEFGRLAAPAEERRAPMQLHRIGSRPGSTGFWLLLPRQK